METPFTVTPCGREHSASAYVWRALNASNRTRAFSSRASSNSPALDHGLILSCLHEFQQQTLRLSL